MSRQGGACGEKKGAEKKRRRGDSNRSGGQGRDSIRVLGHALRGGTEKKEEEEWLRLTFWGIQEGESGPASNRRREGCYSESPLDRRGCMLVVAWLLLLIASGVCLRGVTDGG